MDGPPKLKRKKKVDKCPNPLFVQWLTEWRDQAAEKGIKTQYAFGKALSALKKYPLPLHSGKAAKILDNFGDKICKMLDKKLEEHIAEHGDPFAESSSMAVDTDRSEAPNGAVTRDDWNALRVPPPPDASPRCSQSGGLDSHSSPSQSQKKRKTPNKRAREYVPVYKSGPYALILTLYRNHIKPGSKGYMTKTELQRDAQPLCEKSMTIPDPGSHYTAWSSMSTLISKGYIYKEGSPARYIITELGCELAHRLEAVDARQRVQQTTLNLTTARIGSRSSSEDDTSVVSQSQKPLISSSSHGGRKSPSHQLVAVPLCYWYITDEGKEVHSKDHAAVNIDDDMSIGFLIKCKDNTLKNSSLRYKVDTSRAAPNGYLFAFLHNDDAPELCPAPSKTNSDDLGQRTAIVSSISSSSTASSQSTSLSSSNATTSRPLHLKPSVSSVPHIQFNISADSQDSIGSSMWSSQPSVESAAVYSDSNSCTGLTSDTSSSARLKEPPTPIYSLRPGQFDVMLCVDNCETAGVGGGAKGRKQVLLKELQKNGVGLDVRKLQVGDFVWIAREKSAPVLGMLQMPKRREVVLDYVVERKRMDDLCSSIQDGRFKEQKFRLKQCGLRKPIYLVEEFGSSEHMSLPATTLRQAPVNTQVIDGFFIKYTHDTKESVAYLTIMTRYLQSYYAHKTLEAYHKDDLEKLDVVNDLSSHRQYLMTFEEFNDASVKNKETTVTETFAKHLLQFSGLTAEKALAITQIYRTPSDLMRAYESCISEKDKEKLLARIKYGNSQRNMGPMLSKLVYQLYCTPGPLT